MRDALDVAIHFVESSGFTKTNLQVLKLTYISHGHMLALYDEPLINDKIEAWTHGPVIPAIYHEFKKWKSGVIGSVPYKPTPFTERESGMLSSIFAHYGKFCGYYLSQITHEDGEPVTPWKQCYQDTKNVVIPDEITKAYYKKICG